MTVSSKIKSHPSVVDYFKEIPFHNKPIEKPKIKCLKNIDLLSELPLFYEELSVIKTNHAFRGYAKSFKIEIIERKDSINQLEASTSSIKGLFSDLINETKVTLKKSRQMEKLNLDQFISIQQQRQ